MTLAVTSSMQLAEAIIKETFGRLPATSVKLKRDIVGRSGDEQIAYTVKPTKGDAAALFILIIASDMTVLTGEGIHRNRIEYPKYKSAFTEMPFEVEFRNTLEAVIAGRIEDTVSTDRHGRVVNVKTRITLASGKVISTRSLKRLAFRKTSHRTQYAPYVSSVS